MSADTFEAEAALTVGERSYEILRLDALQAMANIKPWRLITASKLAYPKPIAPWSNTAAHQSIRTRAPGRDRGHLAGNVRQDDAAARPDPLRGGRPAPRARRPNPEPQHPPRFPPLRAACPSPVGAAPRRTRAFASQPRATLSHISDITTHPPAPQPRAEPAALTRSFDLVLVRPPWLGHPRCRRRPPPRRCVPNTTSPRRRRRKPGPTSSQRLAWTARHERAGGHVAVRERPTQRLAPGGPVRIASSSPTFSSRAIGSGSGK